MVQFASVVRKLRSDKKGEAIDEKSRVEYARESLSDLKTLIQEIKHIKGGASAIVLQESWYRDQYKRTLGICFILSLILLVSFVGNIIQLKTEPKPKYFAATTDLRLAPLVALNEPMVTQSGLLNWTVETVSSTFSLDFKNWRKQLMAIRYRYSGKAFSQLVKSYKDSGNLEMIKNQRLVTGCTITKAPVILAKGVVGGKVTWKVEFPILVSYESSKGIENTQKLIATVMIQRVSTINNAEGIQIIQLLIKNK